MKKGDVVKVYEDPITKTRIEGRVQLLKKLGDPDCNMERWQVMFLLDCYFCERNIRTD